MEFEWDPGKAAGDFGKHKVSFTEAATVFRDFLSTGTSIDTLPLGCPVGAGPCSSPMRNAAEGFESSVLEN
jgi:hypothetical protein